MLRANGSTLVKPGFIAVYQEGRDDGKPQDDDDRVLPAMGEGDAVELVDIAGAQHFTEPPPRYSEASLVKALEEHGIGRPSTYAIIISTLKDREYVEMDARRFIPTDIGKIVNGFLVQALPQYVDYGFTAALEDELDAVSRGEEDWIPLLERSGSRSSIWSSTPRRTSRATKSRRRASSAPIRRAASRSACAWAASARSCRSARATTRTSRSSPGCGPARRWTRSPSTRRWSCSSCRASWARRRTASRCSASVGRFGPYVKYGAKYVSLKDDDPYTIELPRALEVIAAKKEADANRSSWTSASMSIQVLNGRYGPYITDKERNAQDSEGSRSQDTDARRVPRAARGRTAARLTFQRQEESGGQDEV